MPHRLEGTGEIPPEDIYKYIAITNLPVGLEATYQYINDTEIEVELLGKADHHTDGHDVAPLLFYIQRDLFASKIDPARDFEGEIDFIDKPTLSISPNVFSEVDTGPNRNTGVFTNSLVLSFTGDVLEYIDRATGVSRTPTSAEIKANMKAEMYRWGSMSNTSGSIINTCGWLLQGQAKSTMMSMILITSLLPHLVGLRDQRHRRIALTPKSILWRRGILPAPSRALTKTTPKNDGSIINKNTLTIDGGAVLQE